MLATNNQLPDRGFKVYPILLCVYPLLALLAANLGEMELLGGLRALVVSLLFGVLLYGLLRLLLGSWGRAAVLSTFLLALFFSYGHVFDLIKTVRIGGISLDRHYFLAPVWMLAGLIGTWLLARHKTYSSNLHMILNTVVLVLVFLAGAQAAYTEVRSLQVRQPKSSPVAQAVYQPVDGDLPDVYWIVLDGYARSDALLEDYGYDNQPFINQLEEMGFVVPTCTLSNYMHTALSLSSVLHMDYVENFFPSVQPGVEAKNWLVYHDYLVHNPVRDRLEALGYQTIAFENGISWAEIKDADFYLSRDQGAVPDARLFSRITDFEQLFLRTTFLRVPEKISFTPGKGFPQMVSSDYRNRFDQVNFSLDELPRVAQMPGRKFVTAHIMAPHSPFVFDAQGNFVAVTDAKKGYAPEVAYLNGRVLVAVQTILAESKTPPVIVIQGDHGWEKYNRTRILNAYYLPGDAGKKVYPGITPVNTFRIILNSYFGGQYPLLEDKSLSSEPKDVYRFDVVAPSCIQE